MTRRSTLSALLAGAAMTVAAPVIYAIARFLAPPARLPASARVPLSDLPSGTTRVVKLGLSDAIVMRDADGRIDAYSLTCTHAGCNVTWREREGEFLCPCHGGRFARDGAVLEGPPKEPLVQLHVVEIDDVILVSEARA